MQLELQPLQLQATKRPLNLFFLLRPTTEATHRNSSSSCPAASSSLPSIELRLSHRPNLPPPSEAQPRPPPAAARHSTSLTPARPPPPFTGQDLQRPLLSPRPPLATTARVAHLLNAEPPTPSPRLRPTPPPSTPPPRRPSPLLQRLRSPPCRRQQTRARCLDSDHQTASPPSSSPPLPSQRRAPPLPSHHQRRRRPSVRLTSARRSLELPSIALLASDPLASPNPLELNSGQPSPLASSLTLEPPSPRSPLPSPSIKPTPTNPQTLSPTSSTTGSSARNPAALQRPDDLPASSPPLELRLEFVIELRQPSPSLGSAPTVLQ